MAAGSQFVGASCLCPSHVLSHEYDKGHIPREMFYL